MTALWVLAHDAISSNVKYLPSGQKAGYTTGPGIAWTPSQWAANPGAVRIDQDFAASDPSADTLDVERGAATFADCPVWAKKAQIDFDTKVRPGQRRPSIYESASNVTAVVNSLIHGGVRGGVGLHVANWNLTEAQAVADVIEAAGPFEVIGIQFTDAAVLYDTDVYSEAWLSDVSGGVLPPAPNPTVHLGSTGPWVHLAQMDLNRHGAVPLLVVDGAFGVKTETAVVAFQKSHWLLADGVVGPLTWTALAKP